MEKTGYYSVTVRKFNVLSRHTDWMRKTQELYNEIVYFYYSLYLDIVEENNAAEQFAHEGTPQSAGREKRGDFSSSQEAMRELEKMTIIGREKKPVSNPLPWKKVPLYFRRAAINTAIAAARSFLSRKEQKTRTEKFAEPVTFYKGMYKDFTGNEIFLKLWNGSVWQWTRCKLRGNTVPQEGQMMSPSLIMREKRIELHIPWKTAISDMRTAKQKMADSEKVCSVVFTNQNALMVCCIIGHSGEKESCLFLKGGAEYAFRCRTLLERVEKSQKAAGGGGNPRANRKYWEKLKNLNDYYSHQYSRQAVDYCKVHEAKIIVLPQFENVYQTYIMKQAGNFSPIHLSSAIREKIKYKAWREGITVLESVQHNINSVCSVCGGQIKTHDSLYQCENGHQGNRYLNSAWNLGIKCRESFRTKQSED